MMLARMIRSVDQSILQIYNANRFLNNLSFRNLFQACRNSTNMCRICCYRYLLQIHKPNYRRRPRATKQFLERPVAPVLSSCYYASNYSSQSEDVNKEHIIKNTRENVVTLPNILTTSRILVTPFLGYLVVQQSYPLAFGIFIFAGITDALDGYIARKWNQKTALGSALDPLADKLLVSVMTVTLTMSQLIPGPLAVIILGRDMLLILASVKLRYTSLPPPKTFASFCDIGNVTVKLHPSNISKFNTFLQITLIASSLAAPVFGFVDHIALQTLWYTTGTTTILSGIGYYLNKDQSVEILHKNRSP